MLFRLARWWSVLVGTIWQTTHMHHVSTRHFKTISTCAHAAFLWGFAQLISMTVILWPKLQKLSMTHCQTSQADWQLKYKLRKDLIQTLDFVNYVLPLTAWSCTVITQEEVESWSISFWRVLSTESTISAPEKPFWFSSFCDMKKKSVGVIFHSFNASQNLMRSWAEKDRPGLLIIVGWFILKMFSLIIAVIFYKH